MAHPGEAVPAPLRHQWSDGYSPIQSTMGRMRTDDGSDSLRESLSHERTTSPSWESVCDFGSTDRRRVPKRWPLLERRRATDRGYGDSEDGSVPRYAPNFRAKGQTYQCINKPSQRFQFVRAYAVPKLSHSHRRTGKNLDVIFKSTPCPSNRGVASAADLDDDVGVDENHSLRRMGSERWSLRSSRT